MSQRPSKGAVLRAPDGRIAIRMGAVIAGKYFVVDPDNGGYYSPTSMVGEIESWVALLIPEVGPPPG